MFWPWKGPFGLCVCWCYTHAKNQFQRWPLYCWFGWLGYNDRTCLNTQSGITCRFVTTTPTKSINSAFLDKYRSSTQAPRRSRSVQYFLYRRFRTPALRTDGLCPSPNQSWCCYTWLTKTVWAFVLFHVSLHLDFRLFFTIVVANRDAISLGAMVMLVQLQLWQIPAVMGEQATYSVLLVWCDHNTERTRHCQGCCTNKICYYTDSTLTDHPIHFFDWLPQLCHSSDKIITSCLKRTTIFN